MAALQMMDLLKKGESFHLKLANFYRTMSKRAVREDTREILDYLSHHEDQLSHCLEKYEHQAPPCVVNHWFQWVPEVDSAHRLESVELSPDATSEDVIDLARRLDDCQVQLYQEMVEVCPPGDLREALGGLLEMERQQEKLLVRNLQTW